MTHEQLIDKLKELLFIKLSPAEWGFDASTEKILPAQQSRLIGARNGLGGIGYKLLTHPGERVEIVHDGGDDFVIYAYHTLTTAGQKNEHTRLAMPATWSELRVKLHKVIYGER